MDKKLSGNPAEIPQNGTSRKQKRLILYSIITLLLIVIISASIHLYNLFQNNEVTKPEYDCLKQDTTWSGTVYIDCNYIIPEGVTLTVEPGTRIKFKYDRNYKTFNRGGLIIEGGTVIAKGTPNGQIWFTSSADKPINGDWNGITINNSSDSIFDYVIVEYGEMGIEQFDSSVSVTNSIIRWSNAEGLYAERSSPYFAYNTLYGNGYHDIALEQYNTEVEIINNKFLGSRYSIHHEETESTIKGNYFKDILEEVITAGMESHVIINENKFEISDIEKAIVYDTEVDVVIDSQNNDFGDGTVAIPEFDYDDIRDTELGYLPGDTQDEFPYIYNQIDETRKTMKKLGKGLGFGWSLEFAQGYLWMFNSHELNRIDPDTGDYQTYYGDPEEIMNPRGLTWDGKNFWINDFSLLSINKLGIIGDRVEVLKSFNIPNKEEGGSNGLASDDTYLYFRDRTGEIIYKLTKDGEIIDTLEIPGGPIVYTGEYFWTVGGCEKGICKYSYKGILRDEFYPPAKDAWAITWDGKYIWTRQRTCEMWNDPKVYQIEVF